MNEFFLLQTVSFTKIKAEIENEVEKTRLSEVKRRDRKRMNFKREMDWRSMNEALTKEVSIVKNLIVWSIHS